VDADKGKRLDLFVFSACATAGEYFPQKHRPKKSRRQIHKVTIRNGTGVTAKQLSADYQRGMKPASRR
jgi:hypothetical protein